MEATRGNGYTPVRGTPAMMMMMVAVKLTTTDESVCPLYKHKRTEQQKGHVLINVTDMPTLSRTNIHVRNVFQWSAYCSMRI